MMAHFDSLKTPIGAVHKYPTTNAQEQRFSGLGFLNIKIVNLWEFWNCSASITVEDRVSLDTIEPFDEWEEFALFGSHYFLLVADNCKVSPDNLVSPRRLDHAIEKDGHFVQAELLYSENPKGRRRFAAALDIRSPAGSHDSIGNFAGMGLNTRTSSCDVYVPHLSGISTLSQSYRSGQTPSARMCHSLTDLGEGGQLLVGGRSNPEDALADCWLYHKWVNIWERIDDLPQPRYRHSAVNLGHGCVLVSSGRSSSRAIAENFFVWSRRCGWRLCVVESEQQPCPTYGSTFSIFEDLTADTRRSGVIAGGINEHGLVRDEVWEWTLSEFSSRVSDGHLEDPTCIMVGNPLTLDCWH